MGNDTLVVYFSFEFCPPGFDAVWFFMDAELKRIKTRLKKLHIVLCSKSLNGEKAVLEWRLYHVILPILHLFPSVASYAVFHSKHKAALSIADCKQVFPHHPFAKDQFDLSQIHRRLLAELPKQIMPWGIQIEYVADQHVKAWVKKNVGKRKLIVITLRISAGIPKRNSRVSEWARFAKSCDIFEYFPVFVMDTDSLSNGYPNELSEFCFFDAASWNLSMRAALYENAYLNLTINAGPTSLCFFNPKCRFVQFKVIVEGEPRASLALLEGFGFIRGKNLSWATPFQKLVWEDDTYGVIQREFDEMCRKIESSSLELV